MKLPQLPECFGYSTYLVHSISCMDEIIIAAGFSGLPETGVIVINRVDSYGTTTPSSMEVVGFKQNNRGVLRSLSRGMYGTPPKAHATGALIELLPHMIPKGVCKLETSLEDWIRTFRKT